MHFLGIQWNNNEKIPFLMYRNNLDEAEINCLPIIAGNIFTISIQQKRFCVGHSEKKFICRNTVMETHQRSSQCDSCKAKDSIHFIHLDGLNYDQLEILKSRPSINYINIFGNKIIKTGVSAKMRKFTRVLEQGALATMFFTDTDGSTSRIIENLVSKTLKIKQAVTWDIKIQYLQNLPTKDECHKELTTIYNQITEMLDNKYLSVVLTKPEYSFNQDYYSLSFPKNINKIDLFEKFNFNDIISGKIIGIYGEIIFLKQKDESVIGINMKTLQGFLLQISEIESHTNIKNKPKQIKLYKKLPENLALF